MYALIELLGHRRIIGRYGPAPAPLSGLLRVEIIDGKGVTRRIQNVGPASIYALTELTADEARALAASAPAQDPVEPLLLDAPASDDDLPF